jgi:malic enzyme
MLGNRFVQLVREYHPHSLLHFEDFGTANAGRLLEKYRGQHAVFNDDMWVHLQTPIVNHPDVIYQTKVKAQER